MSPTMSQASVAVFLQGLGALSEILAKAGQHAEARKIDPAVLVGARLYPDMFPVSRQVQIAADFAKGTVARLAGREPPKWTDDETTLDQLRERIARTIAYIREIPTAEIDAGATRDVTITMRGEPTTFAGPGETLSLRSIDASIPVDAVYQGMMSQEGRMVLLA